jgi:ParG
MSKKVSIAAKPSARLEASTEADKWVENRKTPPAPAERMKRLTIDVPESLHRRLKMSCAGRGIKMADEIRSALETLCKDNA